MNSADAFNAGGLQRLRSHIAIVHHVPGRIRVRLGAALQQRSLGMDRARLQDLLATVEGIHEVRFNPEVAFVGRGMQPFIFARMRVAASGPCTDVSSQEIDAVTAIQYTRLIAALL